MFERHQEGGLIGFPSIYVRQDKLKQLTGAAHSPSRSVNPVTIRCGFGSSWNWGGATARQACYRAVAACKVAGGRVSFDPNLRLERIGPDEVRAVCRPVLAACDLLLPSSEEAAMLTGEADAEAACRALVAQGVPIVALKRAARRSTIFTATEELDIPPLPVAEVDPTGAGDCYGAGFVVRLLEGWDLARTGRFANIVGALAVTQKGPMEGIPWREEALARMR